MHSLVASRPHSRDGIDARNRRVAGQRGIVLIVALIVMVALSFAGVALVRAVDTTTAVVANLAFRQAAIAPANQAVETAAAALFQDANRDTAITPLIADKTRRDNAHNYFANWQNTDNSTGVPSALLSVGNFGGSGMTQVWYDSRTETTVRWMIERSCDSEGPDAGFTATQRSLWYDQHCDKMPPVPPRGSTTHDENVPLNINRPFYRVTVRVDGPKNTVVYLQAMLR